MHSLILLAALLAAPAAAEPLDRVVAVVGDQLVLASDLSLIRDLNGHDRDAMPVWTPTGARAIDLAAVRELAGDLSVYAPRPDQVAARLDSVRDSFETYDAFDDFLVHRGMTEGDLLALLRRRLVVEQYIRRNLDTPPTDPAFAAAAEALFAAARERVVIRTIAPQPR